MIASGIEISFRNKLLEPRTNISAPAETISGIVSELVKNVSHPKQNQSMKHWILYIAGELCTADCPSSAMPDPKLSYMTIDYCDFDRVM